MNTPTEILVITNGKAVIVPADKWPKKEDFCHDVVNDAGDSSTAFDEIGYERQKLEAIAQGAVVEFETLPIELKILKDGAYPIDPALWVVHRQYLERTDSFDFKECTKGRYDALKILGRVCKMIATIKPKSECAHTVTTSTNGKSYCKECGVLVMEIESRPCGDCKQFKTLPSGSICEKKLMGVTNDMLVNYYLKAGTCFEPKSDNSAHGYTEGSEWIIKEIERRRDLIMSEPDGVVRETMISNLLVDIKPEPTIATDSSIENCPSLMPCDCEEKCAIQKAIAPAPTRKLAEKWFIGLPQRNDRIYEFTYDQIITLLNEFENHITNSNHPNQ